MGKAKKGGKAAAAAAPKCTCDHPFKCSCGNRPERPSKGHKWDPEAQAWGGKGHKQKGASGQTASIDKGAQTTAVGKTRMETWQKLPSQLLQDNAKRQKFQRPKYKALESKPSQYKYRIILPDPKDAKKDLFFVPPAPVANEEQAKEEAALLALLHITPSLPHERTLPEPYRTTWLAAIQQKNKGHQSATTAKGGKANNNTQSATTHSTKANPSTTTTATTTPAPSSSSNDGAQASTNLFQGRVMSQAEKAQRNLQKRQIRNERIRKHEAMVRANRNPRVIMSGHVRSIIESLLRGDDARTTASMMMNEDAEDAADEEDADTDAQKYVQDMLLEDGFPKKQSRRAFTTTQRNPQDMNEDQWDKAYEECLQWLLLHLDEKDLPEKYNPEEGQLEVVASGPNAEVKRLTALVTPEGKSFASRYGITLAEAAFVMEHAAKAGHPNAEKSFWDLIVKSKQLTMYDQQPKESELDADINKGALEDEIEALTAIYDEGCTIETIDNDLTSITIQLEAHDATLKIIVKKGHYPAMLPEMVLLSCDVWPKPTNMGTAIHGKIAEFMSTMELDQAAVFQIQNYVVSLLDDMDALESQSLINTSTKAGNTKTPANSKPKASKPSTKPPIIKPRRSHRPRERSPFWSIPPSKTPAATAFPTLGQSLKNARGSLPAAAARGNFLELLEKSQKTGRVVLLTGETGCGKSTQIPQYILEEHPSTAKIVVCQPRRVAATGVASRVAEERGEDRPGVDSVGYVVRGDSAICDKSRLVFCTTGVLLRQLQSENALDSLTHIVLDEVHERSLDMDILLALLKEKLASLPHLTVVLMSATMDAEKMGSYWGRSTPTIHIPGRTFPVRDFFLEDVLELTRFIPSKRKGGDKVNKEDEDYPVKDPDTREVNGISMKTLVARVDETSVDYRLVSSLVKYIISNKEKNDDGSILIFLPGAPEIAKALETVARDMSNYPLVLLPLHGGLQPKEQSKVFHPAGEGKHKVIFSTNIAETSVTIPDCTAVIDCGREKQASYDPSNRMPLLIETFCSKASLKQRRGRAGRVRPGNCYKLLSEKTFSKLRSDTEPEIMRSALDQTLLSLLFLGIDCSPGGQFISSLLDPPTNESLKSAIDSLDILGAVNETKNGLTPLGMHLAGIPAPPVVGKILILASILGCRDAGLAMGASISAGRSPLLRIDMPNPRYKGKNVEEEDPFELDRKRKILEARQQVMDQVGNSDHAFLAKLFLDWNALKGVERKRYCERHGLSIPGMRDILQLYQQFQGALSSIGYLDSVEANKYNSFYRIIRAVAVAAMSPGQLVKVKRPGRKYQETAEGAKEKQGKAQELKFFVRTSRDSLSEERVFIHPSSGNFPVGDYTCPWLVFNSLVRTSKPFLRDVTECDEYSLLLFGGDLDLQVSKGVVLIDQWCELNTTAKTVALVGGLRNKLDELLTQKVSNPSLDVAGTQVMQIISRLIRLGGM